MDARDFPRFRKHPSFVWNIRFDFRKSLACGVQRCLEQHEQHDAASTGPTFLSIDAASTYYVVPEHQQLAGSTCDRPAGGLERFSADRF